MDRIYSRWRIRIPKIKEKRNRKKLKIIVIFIIAILTVIVSIRAVNPIFEKMSEAEAQAIATKISNEKATEVMANYKYQDLVTIMKDNNGNITAITSNIIPINEIISDVAVKIQEELDKVELKEINIPIGSFTGSKILAGRGPNVNIKLKTIGDVETDFRSEFKEAGINQTLHRLYLQVDCKVAILTPFQTLERNISNQVILAENVIVGITPNTYYNFEGMTTTQEALEIME